MKTRFLSIVFSFLLILSVLYGCTEQKKDNDTISIEYDVNTLTSRFGFMHPDDFQDMTDLGIFWQRPHPGPFIWNEIETSQGVFNWDRCDKEVRNSQKYGVNIIATIWPFAEWDQSSCHSKITSSGGLIFDELGAYRQKPCDIALYKNFISKLVERYDGDGIDDMADLIVPIKYWEVSNEPSMQSDWLVFFIGPAQDYFDILNATYQGVKNADSNAMVVKGGMAGVMEDNTEFWDEVFDLGGDSYFDIGNIHSINSDSLAINGPEYKQFLKKHDIDKPFWITEVELGPLGKDISAEEEMADKMVTSFVIAFASGAEKIFHPGIMMKSGKEDTYYALKTIVDKIDYFSSVEKLSEGQYKFSIDTNVVYVLWGEGNITDEITGQIKTTDVSGIESIIYSDELILSSSPIFVEKI
ncbi:hypothetical protein AYK24_02485 [Thermoplasmatales archaeon SG8-52-4]|nr:MAG: hypothetical protein AYK24_02485 [Thermoplasmatales archaeon SG8-52-4]